eukprot:XP_028353144.1 serine/threonine-protein kinase Nek5-like isoform X2 [Physeter catodon]
MNKYDMIKAIGEGAFGKAYLAKGKSDSKHCVIKEINFEKMPIQEKEASKKEVILLAKMKHPNIVTFFSSFSRCCRFRGQETAGCWVSSDSATNDGRGRRHLHLLHCA